MNGAITTAPLLPRPVSLRSILAGLLVGSLLCASNTYFGLQTGWVTMGSMQAALVGFGIFRAGSSPNAPSFLRQLCSHFSIEENVVLQTTAVATATMPLTAGFIGILPAFGMLSPEETNGKPILLPHSIELSLLWAASMAFFGVFLALPLRQQVIIKEGLKFPSGTATAHVIRVLHANNDDTQPNPPPLNALPLSPGDSASDGNALLPISTTTSHLPLVSLTTRVPSARTSIHQDDMAATSSAPLSVSNATTVTLRPVASPRPTSPSSSTMTYGEHGALPDAEAVGKNFASSWRTLIYTFLSSSLYTLLQFLLPSVFLKSWRIFNWIGISTASSWGWEVQMASGYFGQGMIMGPHVTLSMLAGAIMGWGVLGPIARAEGWAPGRIGDWEKGATGWILWVSLAIMIGDSLTSLGLLVVAEVMRVRKGGATRVLSRREVELTASRELQSSSSLPPSPPAPSSPSGEKEETPLLLTSEPAAPLLLSTTVVVSPPPPPPPSLPAHDEADLPHVFWISGAIISLVLGSIILTGMFHFYKVKLYETIAAFVFSAGVAILAVRALGSTDLNPVSGVGKLSQLLFGVIAPGNVVANLVAGAVAEAAAMQAGDLMQDFKTAHILGVSPRSQLVGQLVGSVASIFVSVAAYRLYASQGAIPSEAFPAPTAGIWVQMARLANGGALLPKVKPFAMAAFFLSALNQVAIDVPMIPILRAQCEAWGGGKSLTDLLDRAARWLPSGVAFAVGMYVQPRWTLPRVIGSMIDWTWSKKRPSSHRQLGVVVASGLVLGEGVAALIVAFLRSVTR